MATRYGKNEVIEELIAVYAEENGERLTKKEANRVLGALGQAINNLTQEVGDTVTLQNFVQFKRVDVPPRNYSHPQTGELSTTEPKEVVRAYSKLKD